MTYTYSVTMTLNRSQSDLLLALANGEEVCMGDSGPPCGMRGLLDAGLVRQSPDPNGTIRPFYALTCTGREFCEANFTKRMAYTRKE